MAGLTWEKRPETVWGPAAIKYAEAIRQGIRELFDAWSPLIEEYMKANAPWRDHSSNARQGLNVKKEEETVGIISLVLAHTVDYGIYLELAHAGVWGIINPTLDIYGPLVWASIVDILK